MTSPRRPSRSSRTPRTPGLVERVCVLWNVAGLLGITLGVTIATKNPFPGSSPALTAIAAIGAGWTVALLFAPWRSMRRLGDDRRTVKRLGRQLREVATGQCDESLDALVLDRDDEFGDFSRLLRETLGRAMADRRASRRIQKTMDAAVRRETSRATARLQRQAATDPLTGLGNRRAMEEKLEEYFGCHRRRQDDYMVAMVLDLDLFKVVNDALGHEVGDQCLIFLGNLLSSTVRREDCAIRVGGDEFVILMPNQRIEEARAAAQRLSALFGQMPWSHDVARPTLSIGLACARCDDPHAGTDLIRRADAALYRAKSAGRNTIETDERPRRAA